MPKQVCRVKRCTTHFSATDLEGSDPDRTSRPRPGPGDLPPKACPPDERIEAIGGVGWQVDQAKAIEQVEANPGAYYVDTGSGLVWLTVHQNGGPPFLTAEADGASQKSLLALREL